MFNLPFKSYMQHTYGELANFFFNELYFLLFYKYFKIFYLIHGAYTKRSNQFRGN
jgi:hypothetical protein